MPTPTAADTLSENTNGPDVIGTPSAEDEAAARRRRRQTLLPLFRAALQFRRRARERRRVQDLRYGSDEEVVRRVTDIVNTIAQAMD